MSYQINESAKGRFEATLLKKKLALSVESTQLFIRDCAPFLMYDFMSRGYKLQIFDKHRLLMKYIECDVQLGFRGRQVHTEL